MEPVNKIQFLELLENKVERHLQEVISNFQNMDNEALCTPAHNGGWSIAQCLEHLNRYGKYYLPQIKNGLDKYNGVSSDTFKSTWLGSYFTRMMDPQTGTKKIKAFKDYIPPREMDAHAVVGEFIEQQELLLSYLTIAKSSNLNAVRIPISISKWIRLRLGDVLQFVIAHNDRHFLQARRVAEQLEVEVNHGRF